MTHIAPTIKPASRKELSDCLRRRKRKRLSNAVNLSTPHPNRRRILTVAEKHSGLTLREIAAARRAHLVINALECPSEAVAKAIVLRHATDYHDRPVLPVDISNAFKLYGNAAEQAGKAVEIPIEQMREDHDPFKVHLERPQIIYADLLFVNQHTYLVSVSAPMYRTMIDHIPSREFQHVTTGLKVQCGRYETRNVQVKKIVFDGESALQNVDKAEMAIGKPLTILPPKMHCALVERRIRTLKERARAALARLKYDLPRSLVPALLSAVVNRLNGEPTSQRLDEATPNEIWTGRRLNIPQECEFAYGDYVTTTAPLDPAVKNTLVSRVDKAIILAPTEGGYWVLLLDTWRRVRRKGNGITRQPLTDETVLLINARAKREKTALAAENKKAAGRKSKDKQPRQGSVEADEEWVYGFSAGDKSFDEDPSKGIVLPDEVLIAEGLIAGHTPVESSLPPTGPLTSTQAHDQSSTRGLSHDGGVTPFMATGQASVVQVPAAEETAGRETTQPARRLEGLGRPGEIHPGEGQDEPASATQSAQIVGESGGERSTPLVDGAAGTTGASGVEEGVEHPPAEMPIPTSRELKRTLMRKLGREADILVGRLMSEIQAERDEEPPAESQRSSRKRKRPSKLSNNLRHDQAAQQYGQRAADDAVIDEIVQIVDKRVFDPVYRHFLTAEQRAKVIRTKIFLKAKVDSAGVFLKLKARLVARGDMENKATFDSLYSPTGSMESAFSLLSIAAFERRKVKIIDLVGAYLTVDVVEGSETYVVFDTHLTDILVSRFPAYKKYVAIDGTFCGRLNKSLYGLCQSSANLHRELRKTLTEKMGFIVNPKDPCVYNVQYQGTQISVMVYVDDILVTGDSEQALAAFTAEFKIHHPEVTEKTGVLMDYLGMKLDFSVDGECSISMRGYTEKATNLWCKMHQQASLHHPSLFSGTPLRSFKAPCDSNLFEVTDSPELPKQQREHYHSMVATMLFMAKRARPDLLCTVAFLATRVTNACVEDWIKLRRLMSYAHSSSGRALVLRPKGIWVEAYTDASFATHPDRKSQTGTVCTIGGAPYYCTSTRQKINAKSAAESEMIAISDSCTMITWGQQFLYYQGYVNLPPARIWEDNAATLFNLARGAATGTNSRHYEVKYFYLSDLEKRGIVRAEYLETAEMTADLLTKGVTGDIFDKLSFKLMTSASDVMRLSEDR